ncbi:hypothetical protein RZ760_017450 [Providencia rettgeri]|nr:hypothetical protein [Providencia rettgeri]
MATMKLELSEPLHHPTEDVFIPPIEGKKTDSQTVMKKRIAEAASKKAHPSEPKKHRRKWAEETLAPLLAQLPANMQQTETAEKLMVFCQLSAETQNVNIPNQLYSEGELPSAEDLSFASLGISAKMLGAQLNKKNTATMKSQTVDNVIKTNNIVPHNDGLNDNTSATENVGSIDIIPSKLVTEFASSLVQQRAQSHKPFPTSRSLLTDVGDTSEKPLSISDPLGSSVRGVSQSSIKVAHHGSTPLSNQPAKVRLTDESVQSELSNTDLLKNNPLTPRLDTSTAKSISPRQPTNPADELSFSQPIQQQPLEEHHETPDVLTMQSSRETHTSTNANAMTGTLSQPRNQASSVNKMADMMAKTASVTSDSVAKVEGRSLTYTFNQWQNSPSVTFELATRGSELLATTTSPEVHRALHENQHLFRSEQPLSIRHEEQRHERQRQQQHEQPEQEDN